MKSKKGLVVLAVILFGSIFFAFTKNSHQDKGIIQKQRLLNNIGVLLEEQHYSPKAINDAFSKAVFTKYLEELDGDKNIFLQTDLLALKKYETTIDDEIHGADIKFTPAVKLIYDKRIVEVMALYKEILSKPFDFTVEESIPAESAKQTYPANEAARKESWRKKMKYLTLERYVDLTEQREKSKVDSIAKRTNAELEKEAREKTLKIVERVYSRNKIINTDDELFNKFINVITNLMDPHTDYFPPVEKRSFDEMMSGHFYGIGAQLVEGDGVVKIAAIVTGGAAWKNGEIAKDDAIIKVAQGKEEPVDISGFDVTDAVKLIRGNKGTEVRLTIKKPDGMVKVVTLIRAEVVQDDSFARSVVVKDGNDKIGYIFLPDFYADFENQNGPRCSVDVAKEIKKLKAQNVKGIVLDLTMNGGGSLYEVVQMVGLFIGEGPVVQVRDKDGKSSGLSDRDNSILYDGPLAVMVNEGSASASEIFAAAIQDYKRGVIVGTATYGKGTVQRNVSLGKPLDILSGQTEFGSVKLTFQKFYRINGGSTQLKGVTPDIVLPDYYDYMKVREKDNPSALPWDEVAKSPYELWNNNFDFDSLIRKENEAVSKNVAFKLIKDDALWMSKNMDSPIDLNIEKYKQKQKLLRSTITQVSNLSKTESEMAIEVSPLDKEKFYNNPDKGKGDYYQRWIKSLQNNLYINQTVKIVKDMINNQAPTVSK